MSSRMGGRIRNLDWFAVVAELAIVILGILIAFQIDRWREHAAERALERTYVQRLIAEVELDIPRIEGSLRLATRRKELAELLIAAVDDAPAAAAEPARFLFAIDEAAFTNTPALTGHTFEDLRTSGHLRLIRNDAVREALFSYHDFDETERQWQALVLAGEQHWFELSAGVADLAQSRWVLDHRYAEMAPELEVGPVMAALARLRARREAVAWLPQLLATQIDHQVAQQRRLDLANRLLQQLRDYESEL